MFPDFLCIGAPKSGTTWLHHNLAQHPQVWLPPTKAIHYFDWPSTSLFERLFGRTGRMRESRAHLWRTLRRASQGHAEAGELGWAVRFTLGARSDAWYEQLFSRPPGVIAGETTPNYCVLPEPAIARIRALMPNAKILYLIRHPVERAWSSAVMHFNDKGRGGIAKQSDVAIEDWLTRAKIVAKCDYAPIIRRWRAVFGKNLLVCFYDELRSDPEGLMRRVQAFLGLPIEIPEGVSSRQNPGHWDEVPMPHRRRLHELYQGPMSELQQVLPSPVTIDWQARFAERR